MQTMFCWSFPQSISFLSISSTLRIWFLFICMCWSLGEFICTTCVQKPTVPEKGIGSPETGSTGSWELSTCVPSLRGFLSAFLPFTWASGQPSRQRCVWTTYPSCFHTVVVNRQPNLLASMPLVLIASLLVWFSFSQMQVVQVRFLIASFSAQILTLKRPLSYSGCPHSSVELTSLYSLSACGYTETRVSGMSFQHGHVAACPPFLL